MILIKAYRSFLNACNGFKTVWSEEHNFRIEVAAAFLVIVAAIYLQFSVLEMALSIIAVILVLTAEIVNTAIEDICDKISPEFDPIIGKIKDAMAAFVTVTVFGAAILGLLILFSHFILS